MYLRGLVVYGNLLYVQRFFKIVFIFLFGKKNTQKKIERKCTKQNQLTHVQQIAVPC